MKFSTPINTERIVDIISSLFILLFIYTGLNKLIGIQAFMYVLPQYPLVGLFPTLTAYAVPITEIIIACLLVIPKTRIWGLIGSLILMSLFSFYVSYLMIFAPHKPCTCGGMLEFLSWPMHLALNIIFVLLAIWGIKNYRKQYPESVSQQFITTS